MPPGRHRRPHNRPLTGNKLGLPPEPSRRLREAQAKQREALQEAQRVKQTIQHRNVCLECDGTGRVTVGPKRNLTRPCDKCRGTGTVQLWPPTIGEALKQRVAAQEGARQTMNALVQAIASDPAQMMASMPAFGQLPDPAASTQIIPAKSQHTVTGRFKSQPAIQQLPTTHPAARPKEPREPPKREGTWWELPEQEELKTIAVDVESRNLLTWDSLSGLMNPTHVQPMTVGSIMLILDEIEVEVDPFDLDKPFVGDFLDVEDSQTGHRIRVQITNLVSTPGSNGDILHLCVSPSITGFDANHLRVEWVHRSGKYKPLHLSPAFKLEKAKEQVERAFREHVSQYLGSPTRATTLRDVKNLAERVISQFKSATVLPDHQVEVVQDPLEPGKINVTVKWKDPTLLNILAKELDEKLPAGVVANLNLEEPEEEPKEAKRPIGREQSFWKLPKS